MAYKLNDMSGNATSLVVTSCADSINQIITKDEKIYWKEV